MIKNIFGKNIKFVLNDDRVKLTLEKELNLYNNAKTSKYDVEIVFIQQMIDLGDEYISPSIHTTVNNGFLANYGDCKVLYKKENDILKIYVEMLETNPIIKFISVDFNSSIQAVGTLLHEMVLVPMTYFFDDLTIIHASSFKNIKSGKVHVIGGTGGVGKTSMELLFCKKDDYSFISDDIAVVDSDGFIYPNLSYPKIYAYNVADDKEFEKIVLSNDNMMGKFQWFFIKKLRGEKRVRRRLSPVKLYDTIEKEKVTISEYIVLSRNNLIDGIVVESIPNIDDSVDITFDVIHNEYNVFHDQIKWHEYNCIINNIQPIVKLDEVFKNSKIVLKQCLSSVDSKYIKLPKNMKHNDFMRDIEEFIK